MSVNPVLPEHILRLMSPEERKAYGKGAITAAEGTACATAKREIQEQKILNGWLNLQMTERKLYAINPRSDKASTIRAGHPDYTVFLSGGRVLLLEMKVEGGLVNQQQIAAIGLLSELGHKVEIPGSASQAISEIKKFL